MSAKITLHPAVVKRLHGICRGVMALPPEGQRELLEYTETQAARQEAMLAEARRQLDHASNRTDR